MNDIILYMWLADVSHYMRDTFSAIQLIWIVSSIALGFASAMYAHDHVERNEERPFMFRVFKRWLWSFLIIVPIAIVNMILPSRDTMRLAAALSAGKAISQTSLGTKAGLAAETILDRIIEESKKEKK